MDIPLPSAESKEEVDDEEEPAEEVEEEIDEDEDEEEDENEKEKKKGDGPGESGAETSESEAVMVSPRHSRAKSAAQVKFEFSMRLAALHHWNPITVVHYFTSRELRTSEP